MLTLELWFGRLKTGYDQCVQSSPAFANGVVYTGGAFDKKVYALDAATGTEKWTYTLDEGLTTAPAIIGNTVYVTSTLGNKTYALNADTGDFIWSFQTGNFIYSSPAVVDGIAYFGAYDGNFYAVGQSATAQAQDYQTLFTTLLSS